MIKRVSFYSRARSLGNVAAEKVEEVYSRYKKGSERLILLLSL